MFLKVKLLFTGLDPANPYIYPSVCFLKSNDAKWVDVIHTDMFIYGTPSFPRMGTAEFFANYGIRYQPNCTFTFKLFTPEGNNHD